MSESRILYLRGDRVRVSGDRVRGQVKAASAAAAWGITSVTVSSLA